MQRVLAISVPFALLWLAGEARALEPTDWTLTAVHGLPELSGLAISPDGERLYAAGTDDLVRVFRTSDLRIEDAFGQRGARMDHLALSPAGDLVAAGDRDGAVTIFDAWSGQELYRMGGNGRPIAGVAWSADGREMGVASMQGPIRLVDGETGQPFQVIQGPGEWFTRVTFQMEARRVAATGRDGHVRIWDLDTGAMLRTLQVGGVETTQMAFSPSGRLVAGGDWDGRIRVWEVDTGKLRSTLPGQGRTGGLVFLDEVKLLARGGDDAPVVWDVTNATVVSDYEPPPRWTGLPPDEAAAPVTFDDVHQRLDAAWSPKNGFVAEAYGDTLRVWGHGQLLAQLDTGLAPIRAVDFSPDGSRLAAADASGQILVRDALLPGVQSLLKLQDGPARSLDWSPDGSRIAVAGPDLYVRVWEPGSGDAARVLYGHEAAPDHVAFHRDQLASSDPTELLLWDVETRQATGGFTPEDGASWFSWADGGQLVVWPTEDGAVTGHTLDGTRTFTSGAKHAGGQGDAHEGRIVSTTLEDLAFLTSGGLRRGLNTSAARFHAVLSSPDGSIMAGGTEGGSVYVLDAKSGQLQTSLRGHAGRVVALAFSSDGTQLATGSEDGTVRVWIR
ncbi:MAG: hypothetical protein GY913_12495 [Proteobacteria bacterium]|nr:hypothetical protein [Pseudomonadota bacterium]